jgi:uncharacterized protein (TIGR02646 family)
MQPIHKRPPPPALKQRLHKLAEDPSPSWKRLGKQRNTKRTLQKHLLSEQGHLCAYCEGRIGLTPGDVQIEHLEPREHQPARTFDILNMVASCMGKPTQDMPSVTPTNCGHARDAFDPAQFVPPTDPQVEHLFDYRSDGTIHPAPGPRVDRAGYMIQHLKLASARLEAARKAAADTLQEPSAWLDPNAEITRLLARDSYDQCAPYRSVLLAMLRRGY